MRYPASEKLEIIRIVEQSHLPVRRILAQIGVPPTTFYRWYDRYVEHGPEGPRIITPAFVAPRVNHVPQSGSRAGFFSGLLGMQSRGADLSFRPSPAGRDSAATAAAAR